MDAIIRRCRKEAAWNTIKEIVYVMCRAGGIGLLVIGGAVAFLLGVSFIIDLCKGYDLTTMTIIIKDLIILLSFGGLIVLLGTIVYETYKENLEKCIERIKNEQQSGDLHG